MVADHFLDNESQELFAEFRVKIGIFREFAQSRDLPGLTIRVSRWQGDLRLVFAHRLSDAKPLCQHVDYRGIDVIDAFAIGREHRVIGGNLFGRALRLLRHGTQN